MARQVADADVRRAIEELQALRDGADPLRAEDVERIREIFAETDLGVMTSKVAALLDQYAAQSEAAARGIQRVQSDFGLEPGQTKRFLSGERLSPEAKREIASQQQALLAEVRREAAEALRQVRPRTSRGPRTPRLSV